jgi:hypothetical protein
MPFISYILLSILFIVLFNVNETFYFWSFIFLKPFIHGISSFKINLFIIYSCVLCFIIAVPGRSERYYGATALKKVCLICILLASIFGVCSFIDVVYKCQLPFGRYAFFFKDHYHTINDFSHMHTTKVQMYYAAQLLHLNNINEKVDTALALAPHINGVFIVLLALCTLAVIACCILLVRPVVLQWNSRHKLTLFIIYAFASFHTIKCFIDGGPFSYDLIPAVIVLHLLFYSQSPDTLYALIKNKLPVYLGVLLLVMFLNVFISYETALLQTPLGILFHVCIYSVLFLLVVSKKTFRVTGVLLIAVCIAYILFYMQLHVAADITALRYRIQDGDRVLHFNYPASFDNKSDLVIDDYSKEMKGKRVIDVYKALGDNPFRNRYTAVFLRNTSVMSSFNGFIFGLIALKSNDTVDLTSNKYIEFQKAIPSVKIKKAVLLKVVFNTDLFPPLWELSNSTVTENNKFLALYYLNYYFRKQGITEYILIPYYYKADNL